MTSKTAEQAELDCIEAMGEPLGRVYHALWQELAHIWGKWLEFVELYGTKPSRIELLNAAAPTFFRIVQDVMWEDIVLHIARMTDPPQSGRYKRLTIQALPTLIDDGSTKAAVTDAIEVAMNASAFCRDWRHRHLAHRNLDLAIGNGADALESGSSLQVRAALDALSKALNIVSIRYTRSESRFDLPLYHIGGAMALLHVLDDGIHVEREREERLKQGIFTQPDHSPPDL